MNMPAGFISQIALPSRLRLYPTFLALKRKLPNIFDEFPAYEFVFDPPGNLYGITTTKLFNIVGHPGELIEKTYGFAHFKTSDVIF